MSGAQTTAVVRAGPEQTPKVSRETMELGSCGRRLGHAASSSATLIPSETKYTLKSRGGRSMMSEILAFQTDSDRRGSHVKAQ